MKIHKSYIAVGMIVAFTLFFELAAHAGEDDQATDITFNQPIQVPGQVLPAGTYLFKLLSGDNLDVVQIFNSNQTHLYATLETIASESQPVSNDATVTLAEQGLGKPDVLLKWFYPGNETGHEFVYSNQVEKQMAEDQLQKFVGNQQSASNSEAGGSN